MSQVIISLVLKQGFQLSPVRNNKWISPWSPGLMDCCWLPGLNGKNIMNDQQGLPSAQRVGERVGMQHIVITMVIPGREIDLGICNACSTHKSYKMDAPYVCSRIFYRNTGNNVSQTCASGRVWKCQEFQSALLKGDGQGSHWCQLQELYFLWGLLVFLSYLLAIESLVDGSLHLSVNEHLLCTVFHTRSHRRFKG